MKTDMLPIANSDLLRKLIYHLRHTNFGTLIKIFERKLVAPYRSFRNLVSEEKHCLVISGCPGDSYRYRCEHQAAQLKSLGLTTDVCYENQIRDIGAMAPYQWLWLHRVPFSEKIGAIIEAARRSGKPLVFDTDDLVFDETMVNHMRATEWMSAEEVAEVYDTAKGYFRTLSQCDFATVSTGSLSAAVRNLLPNMRCIVTPNMLSDEQIALAERALQGKPRNSNRIHQTVTIGYFSGTRTHNADFRECSWALERVLEGYPSVRLMLVGYLDVGSEFARFGARVERRRFVPWQRLANLFANVDINLAPLERDNPFTECKSDLKYLEAAVMAVPTVASPVGSFKNSIEHGENGFLCRTEADWFECLTRLVEDETLRQRMGSAAERIVLGSRTIARGAQQLNLSLVKAVEAYHQTVSMSPLPGNARGFTTPDL